MSLMLTDALKLSDLSGPPGVRESMPRTALARAGLAELLAGLEERSIFHQATAERWNMGHMGTVMQARLI